MGDWSPHTARTNAHNNASPFLPTSDEPLNHDSIRSQYNDNDSFFVMEDGSRYAASNAIIIKLSDGTFYLMIENNTYEIIVITHNELQLFLSACNNDIPSTYNDQVVEEDENIAPRLVRQLDDEQMHNIGNMPCDKGTCDVVNESTFGEIDGIDVFYGSGSKENLPYLFEFLTQDNEGNTEPNISSATSQGETDHVFVNTGNEIHSTNSTDNDNLSRGDEMLSSDGPYRCEYCGSVWTTAELLSKHKSRNTGKKPYECTVCGKVLEAHCLAAQHQRLHERYKGGECLKCGKRFIRQGNLIRHTNTNSCKKRSTSE